MNDLLIKAFDFGIRVIELANYLEEEKRQFLMIGRLLECGTGIGICLRAWNSLPKSSQDSLKQACKLALEAEYLLELMVKTGSISENQSKPILTDCRLLKDETEKLLSRKIG